MSDTIAQLEAQIAAIKKANKPPRIVSVMGKNVQNGDHANFEGHGWQEVNGVVHYTDSNATILCAVNGALHTFDSDERIQVRRYL